jgi:hypothetical protein
MSPDWIKDGSSYVLLGSKDDPYDPRYGVRHRAIIRLTSDGEFFSQLTGTPTDVPTFYSRLADCQEDCKMRLVERKLG